MMKKSSEQNKIENTKKLKTKRLMLRYPELDDAFGIYSAVHSLEFPDQVPLKELTAVDEFSAWLNRLQQHWQKGQAYSWIAEKQGSEELIGQVTLTRMETRSQFSLAFWIHPRQWRKGYATEAVERVLTFGFEELGAETIRAEAGTWNTGSLGVLAKVGMKQTGENPEGYFSWGEPVATIVYEITKKGWKKGRK